MKTVLSNSSGTRQNPVLSVSSITRSTSTATVTTSTAHNLSTGARVRIAGADQADYNGVFEVTVTTTTAFTYTVANSPATPATGTITAQYQIPSNQHEVPVMVDSTTRRLAVDSSLSGGVGVDTTNELIVVQDVAHPELAPMRVAETALTAPGQTTAQDVSIYSFVAYQVVVSSINTNVVLEIQQSADGASPTNFAISTLINTASTGASISANDETITANGTYILLARREGNWARLNFVSETGGTDAVVTPTLIAYT